MRVELDLIPNKILFNPNDNKQLYLLYDDYFEVIVYEPLFEKFSFEFKNEQYIQSKYRYDLKIKFNSLYIDQ